MKDVFTFYRAVDPMKGSWDGYGYFPSGNSDFLAFVTDAPSGASIHTPEIIKDFWQSIDLNNEVADFPNLHLADALNRLQNDLQTRGRRENILYQATIAVACKIGSTLYYCCIGDSVLQIYRNGRMYRLNESEVWDGALISAVNRNTQERQKTQEIRFIGSNGSFVPPSEIRTLDLKEQDLLLLYTDGVEDLLPPDRLLQWLDFTAEEFRGRLEKLFAQDQVKDDATLLALPVRARAAYQPEKEIASIRDQLDKLAKEQKETRNLISEFGSTRVRLEKIEKTLTQVAQDVQRLHKRPSTPSQASRHTVVAAGTGVSARKKSPFLWLIPLLTLVLGTAAGAFLFRDQEERRPGPTPVPNARRMEPRNVVAPPEIPSSGECTYVIQKGDTLQQIAASRELTVEQLLSWNPSQKKDAPLLIGNSLTVCKETP
jgi:serine/threonine protein phosphatase PrpC